MRPFVCAILSIAHKLDPDSFLYWNILQFLFIWLKGISLGCILWWLYPRRWIAILGGVLFMLYPADTQQLPLRTLIGNSTIVSLVLAFASLLWATRLKQVWARTLGGGCAAILLLYACLTYELVLFLAPTPLLLWWVKYGLKEGWRSIKTQKLIIFFWLTAIIVELGYLFWIGSEPNLYQSGLSNNPENTLKTVCNHAPLLIKIGLYRIFLHGWYDAARMLFAGGEWIAFFPIALLSIFLMCIGLSAKNSNSDTTRTHLNPWFLTRWLIASLLIATFGYLPYLVSLCHLFITQRTYLIAAIGGALFFTGLILAVQKHFRFLGAAIAGCFLLCGIAAQWTQLAHYKEISDKQRIILSGILEAAPHVDPKKRLLIINHSGSLSNTWFLGGGLLNSALTYLYGTPISPIVCLEPGHLCASCGVTPLGRLGTCIEKPDAWQIGQGLPDSFSLPKTQLVTLIIEPDGQVHPQIPDPSLLPATSSQQARWAKILGCWPAKACRTKSQKHPLPDHFTFNFGEWWSMEEPTPGVGWQDTQWTPPAWQPRSFAWINAPQSSLLFHLSPQSAPYLLQLNLLNYISEQARISLKIVLNGHSLHHQWQDTKHAIAKIDPLWLKEGFNELLFLTNVDPNQGVSLGVESVKIAPLTQENNSVFQNIRQALEYQDNFDFTNNGHVNKDFLTGFIDPEPHGTWTYGDMASFQCYKPKAGDPLPTKILITASGFNPNNHVQRAIFTINGAKPIEYLFTAGEQKIIELPIPHDNHDKIKINIALPDSIKAVPEGAKLGITIKSIKFL